MSSVMYMLACKLMPRGGNPELSLMIHCLCPALRGLLSSVQSLSHAQLFSTPWTAARQASLSITNSWSLLKFMSVTTRNYIFEFF